MRAPWWLLRSDQGSPDELNGPDDDHRVRVVTRRDALTGGDDEAVWATPETAAQWAADGWEITP